MCILMKFCIMLAWEDLLSSISCSVTSRACLRASACLTGNTVRGIPSCTSQPILVPELQPKGALQPSMLGMGGP